jgi:lysozyme
MMTIPANISQRRAFLNMIAWSEIGSQLLAASDNGYNVLVGSTPAEPSLFDSYADHPRKLVRLASGISSTAAGRYQLLERYWDAYKAQLGLHDFSPISQDTVALIQIKERQALAAIDAGDVVEAIHRCSNIWASLPGANYGQRENQLDQLIAAFESSGGNVSKGYA